ncbi:hypothetical protein Acsp04_58920 [Actinomadura sp. NBRC 104425]|uniref:helix-turn-helix transcriptional regulator n=1 Tax=Actinomadura sp. NBRC 104425 TaxID=3032204 RepID=UPI0024A48EAC|nr:helix-turn-helix domain-containing protein [Actinomadura sp. NBRC 104425]GLZ15657.1 hypothetical protein Acsp04_58920 [Actinomadura sp. NBRC 104425]
MDVLKPEPLCEERYLTTEEVAALIGVDPSTLRRWRTGRPMQGPPFVKVSESVTRYSVTDVREWLLSRRVDPAKVA